MKGRDVCTTCMTKNKTTNKGEDEHVQKAIEAITYEMN